MNASKYMMTSKILATAIFLVVSVFCSYSQDRELSKKMFDKGQSFLSQGQWDSCIFYFKKAQAEYAKYNATNYGLATYKCGYCALRTTDVKNAIPYFNEVIRVIPQISVKPDVLQFHQQSHLDLAYIYMAEKDYEQSNRTLEGLNEILKTDSSLYGINSYVAMQRFWIYNLIQLGKYDSTELKIKEAQAVLDTIDYAQNRWLPDEVGGLFAAIGDYYGRIGNYDLFKDYIDKTLGLFEQHFGKDDKRVAWPLLGKGNYQYHMSYYHESLDSYERAIRILNNSGDSTSDRYAQAHEYSYQVYNHLEEWDKALEHLDEAMKIFRSKPHLTLNLYKASAGKAEILSIIGKEMEAEQQLQFALNVFETHPDNKVFIHDILLYVTGTYDELGQLDMAEKYGQIKLGLAKDLYPSRSFELAQDYHALALIYHKKENFDLAKNYIDSARVANRSESGEIILPLIQVTIESLSLDIMNSQEAIDPDLAMSVIKQGSSFIRSTKADVENDIRPMYQPQAFYHSGIDLIYRLSKEDKNLIKLAFELSEEGRSFDLKNYLKKSDQLASSNLPKELIDKRKELLDQLLVYRYKLDTDEQEGQMSVQNKYDSIKLIYENVIADIAEQNPNYFRYKYDTTGIDTQRLEQILLESNAALISYHLSNDYLYVISYKDNKWDMVRKDWSEERKDQIIQLRNLLSSPDNYEEYEKLTQELATYLVGTPIDSDKLIVIPDNVLNYVPFELLILPDGKYLFEDAVVRYAYSAETILNEKSSSGQTKPMIAMAPEFKNAIEINDPVRSAIAKLPFARQEAQEVSQIMNGEFIEGANATEAMFKENSPNYQIIHLSTHAIVDDTEPSNSRLIFSTHQDSLQDGYLNSFEIYNLDLSAQLVTLSACNTGFGKIKKGEGVMSLSRAFAYAGVPATVVSLWPASDKSTPELMKHFYQNLANGDAKDVALNNARKAYLATATGKARHPFYWGGFVLIGDNSPIQTGSTNVAIILSILFLITALPIVIVIKQKYLKLED